MTHPDDTHHYTRNQRIALLAATIASWAIVMVVANFNALV